MHATIHPPNDVPAVHDGAATCPPSTVPAVVPAPTAAVALSTRADQVIELGKMIEKLSLAKNETTDGWMRIALEQQEAGFPDVKHLENATAHLRRLASDLFNTMADCEYRLGIMRAATTRKASIS